jgi:hypothetical protein
MNAPAKSRRNEAKRDVNWLVCRGAVAALAFA